MGGGESMQKWLVVSWDFFFLFKIPWICTPYFSFYTWFSKVWWFSVCNQSPCLVPPCMFFCLSFFFFFFFFKMWTKKIFTGGKNPISIIWGGEGGEGEGEGDTSSPPSPIKPLYISVYVRRCSPKCQFIVLCYICMYICMYMRTIKNVRQHKIRICIKGIQPESFDQETIRGAPRAAATVVTRGYYLSKSTYIWNKCAILPAWLAFWSCTGNFFFLVCTTWLRGFVRTYDPFLTTYMRMEALPSPGSSRLLECSWSWKYSFAQVGEA